MADNELFGISEQLESGHEKDHVADHGNMVGDLIGKKYGCKKMPLPEPWKGDTP